MAKLDHSIEARFDCFNEAMTKISHFIDACRTGKSVKRRLGIAALGTFSREGMWPQVAETVVAEVDTVHPDAQMQFLKVWTRVRLTPVREYVADDDLFFAMIRRLLPPYGGELYDGELYDGGCAMASCR